MRLELKFNVFKAIEVHALYNSEQTTINESPRIKCSKIWFSGDYRNHLTCYFLPTHPNDSKSPPRAPLRRPSRILNWIWRYYCLRRWWSCSPDHSSAFLTFDTFSKTWINWGRQNIPHSLSMSTGNFTSWNYLSDEQEPARKGQKLHSTSTALVSCTPSVSFYIQKLNKTQISRK